MKHASVHRRVDLVQARAPRGRRQHALCAQRPRIGERKRVIQATVLLRQVELRWLAIRECEQGGEDASIGLYGGEWKQVRHRARQCLLSSTSTTNLCKQARQARMEMRELEVEDERWAVVLMQRGVSFGVDAFVAQDAEPRSDLICACIGVGGAEATVHEAQRQQEANAARQQKQQQLCGLRLCMIMLHDLPNAPFHNAVHAGPQAIGVDDALERRTLGWLWLHFGIHNVEHKHHQIINA